MGYHLSRLQLFIGFFSIVSCGDNGNLVKLYKNSWFGNDGQGESSSGNSDKGKEKQICTDNLSDYQIRRHLGSGFTGMVYLVWNQATQQSYAMKKISLISPEKRIAQNGLNEERILKGIDSPFIVPLHCSFKDDSNLYLILEYMCGGELFDHLNAHRSKWNEGHVKFYAAQVVLAVEYLHSHNIVHGDIKLENVLLDDQGYVKLADFGAAVMLNEERPILITGSPAYTAPEIILKQNYGKEVDLWALGVLIYLMVDRSYPFGTHSPDTSMETVYRRIVSDQVTFSSKFSPQLIHLLRNLLNKNPGSRYTVTNVKQHPWFTKDSSIDWKRISKKKIPAPFKPVCK